MLANKLTTALTGAGFALLYVVLYQLSGNITGNEAFAGIASVFFLPAFVRLLSFLIIGYWSIPALFVAAMFCVDLGLPFESKIIVSAFLAAGAPLGIALASHLTGLSQSLANLSPQRLLWLSVGSAAGNTIFYNAALSLVGVEAQTLISHLATFIGDVAGTWAIIYLIKAGLTLRGKTFSR